MIRFFYEIIIFLLIEFVEKIFDSWKQKKFNLIEIIKENKKRILFYLIYSLTFVRNRQVILVFQRRRAHNFPISISIQCNCLPNYINHQIENEWKIWIFSITCVLMWTILLRSLYLSCLFELFQVVAFSFS